MEAPADVAASLVPADVVEPSVPTAETPDPKKEIAPDVDAAPVIKEVEEDGVLVADAWLLLPLLRSRSLSSLFPAF